MTDPYNVTMVAPLVPLGDFRRVAILGGGDGGVLNEVIKTSEAMHIPLEQATLVDIDGEVIRLSKEYLPRLCEDAFEHPKAEIVIGDAFEYIEQAHELDGVIYDLTMEPVRDGQERLEFIAEVIAEVAESLRPGGVLSMQCCGEGEGHPELAAAGEQLLQEIRAEVNRHFNPPLEQQVLIPSFHELWTFLSARKS